MKMKSSLARRACSLLHGTHLLKFLIRLLSCLLPRPTLFCDRFSSQLMRDVIRILTIQQDARDVCLLPVNCLQMRMRIQAFKRRCQYQTHQNVNTAWIAGSRISRICWHRANNSEDYTTKVGTGTGNI